MWAFSCCRRIRLYKITAILNQFSLNGTRACCSFSPFDTEHSSNHTFCCVHYLSLQPQYAAHLHPFIRLFSRCGETVSLSLIFNWVNGRRSSGLPCRVLLWPSHVVSTSLPLRLMCIFVQVVYEALPLVAENRIKDIRNMKWLQFPALALNGGQEKGDQDVSNARRQRKKKTRKVPIRPAHVKITVTSEFSHFRALKRRRWVCTLLQTCANGHVGACKCVEPIFKGRHAKRNLSMDVCCAQRETQTSHAFNSSSSLWRTFSYFSWNRVQNQSETSEKNGKDNSKMSRVDPKWVRCRTQMNNLLNVTNLINCLENTTAKCVEVFPLQQGRHVRFNGCDRRGTFFDEGH